MKKLMYIFIVVCIILIGALLMITQQKSIIHRNNGYKAKNKFGFIIVRCMTNDQTSRYWLHCYRCIRGFYPKTPIVIIDDNSDPKYVNQEIEEMLSDCTIIQSEYAKRGEILGYYYLYKKRLFEKAVVLHDSVFLKKKVDFSKYNKIRFLWHFEDKRYDNVERESKFLRKINHQGYIKLYGERDKWNGCFGVMSVIDLDFVDTISGIFILLEDVKSREDRMCIERIFAVLCYYHYPSLQDDQSVLGSIHEFPLGWEYSYMRYKEGSDSTFPPMVKVWTGR